MKGFTAKLKTFSLALASMPGAIRHSVAQRRFEFPFNLQWRAVGIPMDKTLRLPQSIQYPPGMEPVRAIFAPSCTWTYTILGGNIWIS